MGYDLHPTLTPAVAKRVVEHIDEHALEQPGIRVDERQVLRHVDAHPALWIRQREQSTRDHLIECNRLGTDAQRTSLQPARI